MAVVAVLFGAVAVFADSGNLDVQVADRTGYEIDRTADDAIVEYVGDDNATFGSAGTGVINSFLQTQDDPSEEGYNTDGVKEFDTGSSPQFNRAILVSEIPVLACESLDGSETTPGLCWELWADINDSNAQDPAAAQIQLTDLEIWLTDDDEITGYDQGGTGFGTDADKVYDFAGIVLINDVNQGSGRGDMRYLVPLESIDLSTLAPDCDYGSSTCATYFVIYTEWGDPADGAYKSDSGFEEWTVKKYPFVDVEKTATTTFTRTYEWDIDKSVTPDEWALFDGDSGTSDYTIDLDKTGFTDSAWAVSGTITIENTSDINAIITGVTDEISGVGAVTVSCGVTFPYDLDDGDTLECTYNSALPDGTNRTNTAEVTLSDGPVFTDDAAVTFGAPTTEVNAAVNVDDTYPDGDAGPFTDDAQITYSRTFECGADEGTHNNTATIVETGQNDSASVAVTCYDLSVTKTADESRTRTFEWDIDKSVDPDTWDLFTGDSGTSEYTVDITQTGFTDSEWHVEGSITIHNNHPTLAADLTQVTDEISGFGAATVVCPSLTVPAAGDLVCTYEADLPNGDTRTNTATATQQNYDYDSAGIGTADGTTDYQGTAQIDFSEAVTTDVNECVNVDDTFAGDLGEFCDSGSTSYERTFVCDADEGTHENTATIVETGQSDDASVTVTCHALQVTKDADTSFTRTYTWMIDKSADQTELTLMPDQTFLVNYTVAVNTTGFTDSAWAVAGNIAVHNPAPIDATINAVSDVLGADGPALVDCGVTFPYTLVAGGTLNCTYDLSIAAATDQLNTATATLQNFDYHFEDPPAPDGTTDWSGTANVVFGTTPSDEIDECIDVTDSYAGFLGTVCIGDTLPASFNYSRFVGGIPAEECGDYIVHNDATFTTNDTSTSGSDSWDVILHILCPPPGCTLTQGYWKTHSEFGPAPEDPGWYEIGDVDGDLASEGPNETFFLSGDTWYEVFWTNPKKGNAYYILAHQYMAAVLNQANGAGSTTDVDTALAWAETFFSTYEPTDPLSKPLRQEVIENAGILAEYNEGDSEGGPDHCSEDSLSSTAP